MRTLCVAKGEIKEDFYQIWIVNYQKLLHRKSLPIGEEEEKNLDKEIIEV